jgi:hypothetical protein
MSRINLQARDLISFLPTNKMSVKSKFNEQHKILNFSTPQNKHQVYLLDCYVGDSFKNN